MGTSDDMSDASFDHLVVYVPNIAEASQQFSQLGFKVSYGGAHSHTHSALIIFSDQTYIELLALRPGFKRTLLLTLARSGLLDAIAKRKTDMSWRLMRWLNKSYGAIDWCLRTKDIDSLLESCRQNHYEVLKGEAFHRTRPDGMTARWLLGCIKDQEVPFLIEDQTSIDIRVPVSETPQHPNGALRIDKLIIAVDEPSRYQTKLNHLMTPSDDHSKPVIEYVKQTGGGNEFTLEVACPPDGVNNNIESNNVYDIAIHLV